MKQQGLADSWMRASVVFATPRRQVDRHLVIVHHPTWQALDDWINIADRIRRIDPRIEVFIVESDMLNSATRKRAAALPTLVVSSSPLGSFRPLRGKIYHGEYISKFEQVRRLAAAGVRVPLSAMWAPGIALDPAKWGEFVILKPIHGSSSATPDGIQLMRTERVGQWRPRAPQDGRPMQRPPMMVQQFIDTGKNINQYRVLTCFGEALYCKYLQRDVDRVSLNESDEVIENAPIAIAQFPGASSNTYVYNAEVIALARAAYNAIPEVPFQGGDYVQDKRTGLYYVLELNPGGNTWHFSSAHITRQIREGTAEPEPERLTQLDAFGTVARVLAERTRREAQ